MLEATIVALTLAVQSRSIHPSALYHGTAEYSHPHGPIRSRPSSPRAAVAAGRQRQSGRRRGDGETLPFPR